MHAVPRAQWEQRESRDEVCYIDGARYPHIVPNLARVGWAGVFVRGDQIVATAFAPVWQSSMQSFGVAEWTSICGIVQLVQRLANMFTDLVRA